MNPVIIILALVIVLDVIIILFIMRKVKIRQKAKMRKKLMVYSCKDDETPQKSFESIIYKCSEKDSDDNEERVRERDYPHTFDKTENEKYMKKAAEPIEEKSEQTPTKLPVDTPLPFKKKKRIKDRLKEADVKAECYNAKLRENAEIAKNKIRSHELTR